ncbi:MAG: hypothetical protein ACFB10_12030 [Salibacteraceae bacterium]
MKYFAAFVMLCLLFGCSTEKQGFSDESNEKDHLDFLELRVEEAYDQMDKAYLDDPLKANPFHKKGRKFREAAFQVVSYLEGEANNVEVSVVFEQFSKLLNEILAYERHNKDLVALIENECKQLATKLLPNGDVHTIERIRMIEVLGVNEFHEAINCNDYRFNNIKVMTTNHTVNDGDTFSTSIIPVGIGNNHVPIIKIDGDASPNLQLTSEEIIFKTINYEKGWNKISGSYGFRRNGSIDYQPFEIEFEVK